MRWVINDADVEVGRRNWVGLLEQVCKVMLEHTRDQMIVVEVPPWFEHPERCEIIFILPA